jgi:hypothetical protein
MKTIYKHIEFKQSVDNVWHCGNPKADVYLGFFEYVKEWKCYQFVPQPNTAYTVECLEDIAHFISQLDGMKNKKPHGIAEGVV